MVKISQIQWSRSGIAGAAAGCFILVLMVAWPKFSDRAVIKIDDFTMSSNSNQVYHAISNRTLGFQHIYAINLPDRTDHRDGLALTAAVFGIDIDFVPGVKGEDVSVKAMPADHKPELPIGAIGSWRAHVNVIREIVSNDVSTAIVMEDDTDWDVRLRHLLQDLAISSNAILSHTGSEELNFNSLPASNPTSVSPYGDSWDVLWLGHCGMDIDRDKTRVVRTDDLTVPQVQYLESWDPEATSPMVGFANHTRLTGYVNGGVCSLAYAVSQSAARRILYEIGMEHLDLAYDLMLRRFCGNARCIGILPQLFDHHRNKGSQRFRSDINESQDPDRLVAKTSNIRYSVRMNMEKLLNGQSDWDDQFPDV